MASPQTPMLTLVNSKSGTFNDGSDCGDTPTKEDSSERGTGARGDTRTAQAQKPSASTDVDLVLTCEFDCGPPMPRSAMINKGNARSHCWVCHACHSSMKALIRSYSATPESKKLLDDMRTNNKKKWYALVRQCRIRASADEIGVSDIHSRKKAVLEATQSMVQAFGVRDSSEVLWLTHDRVIAHQVYGEGIAGATLQAKEQAAEAKWNRDIANVDIVRRGTGVDTQLGVMGVPRTDGYCGRESNRIVTCSDTIHSKHQMDSIMQILSQHGATAQALTGKAMGEFGRSFYARQRQLKLGHNVAVLTSTNYLCAPRKCHV